jgi:hypothetical protein
MFEVSSTTAEREQKPSPVLNAHVSDVIQRATTSEVAAAVDSSSSTELDSHANMVVLGKQAYVLNDSGKTAQVSPFTPDYDSMTDVPIVDAAIAYDCPITL